MRLLPIAFVAAFLPGAVGAAAFADEPAPAPPPLPAPAPEPPAKAAEDVAGKVAGWILDLSSDDFRTREEASKRLAEAGEAARQALETAAKGSDSLEVRWRAQQLLLRLDDPGERAFDAPGTPGEAPTPGSTVPGPRERRVPEDRMEKAMRELMERMLRRFGGAAPGGRFDPPFPGLGGDPFRAFDPAITSGNLTLRLPLFGDGPYRLERRSRDGTTTVLEGESLAAIVAAHPELKDEPALAALEKQLAERAKNPVERFPGFSFGTGPQGTVTMRTSQGVEFTQDQGGAVLKITTRGEDGKDRTETYRGASLEDIKRQHPELAKQIDSLGTFRFHVGPPRLFGGPREQGLAPMPPEPPATTPPAPPAPAVATFGLYLGPVEPVLAMHLGLAEGAGVLVLRVEPGSQAEAMGVKAFDVIESIGGVPVATHEQAVRALRAAAKDRASLSLGIVRTGTRQTLTR